ncbi:type I glutamate--ammonia ligase [Fervidicoccus fontis]|uniref:Glutamine synthetase n=1 Tax=Fervidicoccus fontis (strain DSM 19380 / JCM 18336 / VKM B-2539 / Kam940) TaxID=1163730 RepID=I0A2K9_FERFK|nr:type I glutamate--ammonia ligase [Fervidicoccus fontis]AFH43216.1 glutamine synthetase [Fervidicoccus fontis Kam940]
MKIEELKNIIEDNKLKWINLQLTDLLGIFRQVVISSKMFDEDAINLGIGKLDGSSVYGFKEIYESDLTLRPVLDTLRTNPFEINTADIITEVFDTFGTKRLETDPRYVAQKTIAYTSSFGYNSLTAAELEFYIFDEIRSWLRPLFSGFEIKSGSAGYDEKTNHSLTIKGGYYVPPPFDESIKIRSEISDLLQDFYKITIESHHHEVGGAGQGEINMQALDPVSTSDNIQRIKYVSRFVAHKYGKIITFMPKPISDDAGNGMHVHVSLWNNGKNAFYDINDDYAGISQEARYFIGGLLSHGKALSAIVSPTVNSYKRLLPHYEAPIFLTWSKGNRSAAVRIPSYHKNYERRKRVEYRPPDPSCNPYLAISAIILAGIDGIVKKIDPGDPIDENIYKMAESKLRELKIERLPSSLDKALDELLNDNEFLRPAFSQSLIELYIELKRKEIEKINRTISPAEFYYYANI